MGNKAIVGNKGEEYNFDRKLNEDQFILGSARKSEKVISMSPLVRSSRITQQTKNQYRAIVKHAREKNESSGSSEYQVDHLIPADCCDYDPEDVVLNYLLGELQSITLGNSKLRVKFLKLV